MSANATPCTDKRSECKDLRINRNPLPTGALGVDFIRPATAESNSSLFQYEMSLKEDAVSNTR